MTCVFLSSETFQYFLKKHNKFLFFKQLKCLQAMQINIWILKHLIQHDNTFYILWIHCKESIFFQIWAKNLLSGTTVSHLFTLKTKSILLKLSVIIAKSSSRTSGYKLEWLMRKLNKYSFMIFLVFNKQTILHFQY